MKRLCRRMDIPLWQAVGIMEMLWQVTAREAPRGDIGKLSDEDIALALDYRGDESALIDHLVAAGWIDRDPSHRLVIHDWYDHADDAVHMRIARSRQFFVRGERPKLARLGGDERTNALKFYESVPAVRTNEAVEHGPRLGPAWAPPGPRLDLGQDPTAQTALCACPNRRNHLPKIRCRDSSASGPSTHSRTDTTWRSASG